MKNKNNRKDWQLQLIETYIMICEACNYGVNMSWQRMSPNADPVFKDEEVLTIFIYGLSRGHKTVRSIYTYTHDHLKDWFPKLPSYVCYVKRLNFMSQGLACLLAYLTERFKTLGSGVCRLLDSMPIILAKAKRINSAKVASDLASRGYCSSKGIWYYGVKLHVLGYSKSGSLPIADKVGLTAADTHDIKALEMMGSISPGEIYADKAYCSEPLSKELQKAGVKLITPTKKHKSQEQASYYQGLWQTAVSRVRQPIESLFAWIDEKTSIQNASKVRSSQGLMVHVFGRFAAAFILLTLNLNC